MNDNALFLTKMKLRIHRDKIERQLPVAATNMCRQIAFSIRVRLPFLLSTSDWESRLRREVRFSLERHRIKFGDMNVEKMAQVARAWKEYHWERTSQETGRCT